MMRGESIKEALAGWRECREEFECFRQSAYEHAHEATNGRLLNRRGITAGVDPWSLFIGNYKRAHAYASEELVEHWQKHPRLSFQEFERQWIDRGRY